MVHLEVVNKNSSCTLPLPLALQALLQLAPQTRQKTYRSCSPPLALALHALLQLAPRSRQTMYRRCVLPLALALAHCWCWRHEHGRHCEKQFTTGAGAALTASAGTTDMAHTGAMYSTNGAIAAIPEGAGAVSSTTCADTAIAAGAGAMYPLMTLVQVLHHCRKCCGHCWTWCDVLHH